MCWPERGSTQKGTGHAPSATEVAMEAAQRNPSHEVLPEKRQGDEIGSGQATGSQRLALGGNGDCQIGVGAEFQIFSAQEKTSPGAPPRRPLLAALQFDRGAARAIVAPLYPADPSRRGLQKSQGRPGAATAFP